MKTKEIEHIAYKDLWKQGTYLCFEVAMPNLINGTRAMSVKERVDLLSHDTKGIWRFYEIKVSKSDFYSKCKNTFLGHFNYYILPLELYLQVKDDIPSHIGVYTVGNRNIYCQKRSKRQDLQISHEELFFNFMQALSREYRKYRKILKGD